MYFAVAIRRAVAVQRTSTVRETGASRIQSCDRGRAGTGASSNDCDGGSNYADPIKSRKLWHWLSSWLLGRAGRRSLPAALLLALALPAALLPLAGPAAAQEVVEVPRGLVAHALGDFDRRQVPAALRHLDEAQREFVEHRGLQRVRAGPGGSRTCRHPVLLLEVRVLGSTGSVDARDNTGTTYTAPDKGVPIYWLNGDQVADDYEDFYDGSWDSGSGRNQSGSSQSDSGCLVGVWTGSNNNGVKAVGNTLGATGNPTYGSFSCSTASRPRTPFTGGYTASAVVKFFYALSPVLKLAGSVKPFGVSITSTPVDAAAGYAAGETIQVRADFGEAVTVTGAPYLVLDIAGVARTAVYDSGSGTRYLNFAYTVRAADFDSNGISLCSSRLLDMSCGRITLDGGSISAQSDGVASELDLPEFRNQSGHKVDGQPVTGSTPMTPAGAVAVPSGWDLVPPGVTRSFRLLFVSSTTRNGSSSDINDYNNHVISAAGAGHSAIQEYKDGFRAIASTEAVDARDNAGLTGTGVPIYWLNGAQVADNYPDLLDGSWDSERWTTEAGGAASSSEKRVWTGSSDAGVENFFGSDSRALGAENRAHAAYGRLNGADRPLLAGSRQRTETRSLYGLSQVLWAPPNSPPRPSSRRPGTQGSTGWARPSRSSGPSPSRSRCAACRRWR